MQTKDGPIAGSCPVYNRVILLEKSLVRGGIEPPTPGFLKTIPAATGSCRHSSGNFLLMLLDTSAERRWSIFPALTQELPHRPVSVCRRRAFRSQPAQLFEGIVLPTVTKNRNRKPVTLHLPVLPQLQEAIDATPSGNLTFLVTKFGKPFTAAGFGNWFRRRCDEAGLPHRSAHGLRKAGADHRRREPSDRTPAHGNLRVGIAEASGDLHESGSTEMLAGSGMPLLVSESGNKSVPLSYAVRGSGTK